jgi:hypothetical protein
MNRLTKLDVFYHDRRVGTMALYRKRLAAFEYDREWLADGFSVSPFSLPLEKRGFMPQIDPLEGIFGVFAKGGSSGGARPKILTKVEDEDWIIKFPSSGDSREIGQQEYEYALCAKACGIEVEKVRLGAAGDFPQDTES